MIELWNAIFLQPILNGLLWLSNMFGGDFGLAIIVMTLLVNIILLPLTFKSTRSMHVVQEKQRVIQPKLKEIQKKYAKDKQKLQQEQFKLYKEHGINPMGCASPMLMMFIQMPFWLAVYQSIISALPTTPERLLGLSSKLYSSSAIQGGVPPEGQFGFINLSEPNFVMVLLLIATMWLSQKMTTAATAEPQQQQTQKMMQTMFPLFFGIIFINFPSGLPLYIVLSNVFRMVVQRFVMGNWGGLENIRNLIPGFAGQAAGVATGAKAGGSQKGWTPSEDKISKEVQSAAEKSKIETKKRKGAGNGGSRGTRKNRGRGNRTRPESNGPEPQ